MAYCGESGAIPRERVIKVLENHQVAVSQPSMDEDDVDGTEIIAGQGTVQAQRMPELIPRRMIHYLSRRFGITIERFYHERRTGT